MKKSFFIIIAALVLCFGLASCGESQNTEATPTPQPTQEETPIPKSETTPTTAPTAELNVKRLKFLTIGNSYGENSTKYIYQVAELCGYDEIIVGQLFIGGTELRHHLTNIEGNNASYTYFKNTTGDWEIITMDESDDPNVEWSMYVPMSFGLADEDWDYIVINAQSFGSGKISELTPYLQGIVDYVRTFSDAPLLWFMPWADTKDSVNTLFLDWYNGEPLVMLQAVMDVTEDYIMPSGNFSAVIPSGTAIQNVRTSFIGDNLDYDEHHLNDLGCYISGMTWVAAIGRYDITQMEFDGSFCTEGEFEVIKAAVDAAIKNPYELTDLSGFKG